MVEFVERVFGQRAFWAMHLTNSNNDKDGGLVDLGGRSSSVSKDECDDVVLWEY